MKKIKLFVIFFFAIIFVLIIYNKTYNKTKNVLLLGENINVNVNTEDYKYKKYLYDNITYKELIRCIKNNEKIILKNKEIYLNQLIANSDYLIINVNNKEYLKKCKNGDVNKYYKESIINEKKKLIDLLRKITKSNIIVIDNSCNIKDKNRLKVFNYT